MTIQKHQLIRFLQEDLAVPTEIIPVILPKCQNLNRLPVILWQYKLVTIADLDRVFQWIEGQCATQYKMTV
ncbi:MAG: DUF2949 domain-containing protein [Leptolyngbyaceae cyanobacterium]|uniref:DUF2949 domain-containing protein n=1 Tax=Leptodesmis sichuanensis TaxID=2906798 RepID=UPI001F17B341|nr:DUF2949 domain-containing protein [Leptodesmis sichuanensis]UIE38850.1 DUF2949 domain-containing protein [Leptodesmis sichuanensis A121]